MALKFLFRGPSSRLETLIEKIQQNKDTHQGDFVVKNIQIEPFEESNKNI